MPGRKRKTVGRPLHQDRERKRGRRYNVRDEGNQEAPTEPSRPWDGFYFAPLIGDMASLGFNGIPLAIRLKLRSVCVVKADTGKPGRRYSDIHIRKNGSSNRVLV